MLQLLTTDEFAAWFQGLSDPVAEDVATALDVIEQLGPAQAAPGSGESLLWYEHASLRACAAPSPGEHALLVTDFGAFANFRGYVWKVIAKLESPRFLSRLPRLSAAQAAEVLRLVKDIRAAADLRFRFESRLADPALLAWLGVGAPPPNAPTFESACAEVRRLYLAALAAAGFEPSDVPAHSLALRELTRRASAPAFRLLYGVHAERERALLVLGEWLDRSYYGDSVRRAEQVWQQFLAGGVESAQPAPFRQP